MPTSFDINTSIQRCLVKAIALHGLGLYIYAGEDLPIEGGEAEERTTERPKPVPAVTDQFDDPLDDVIPDKVRSIKPKDETVTPAQKRYIQKLIAETGADEDKVLDYFGYFTLDTIPKSEASRVIKALEAKRNKEAA